MFAHDSFPNGRAVIPSDWLSGMPHAMDCGTPVDQDRQMHPAIMMPHQNTWLVDRCAQVALRQYG